MTSAPYPRRSDLDALRAAAMLLGILLHAGLSFVPFPWPVQDERQSGFYWFLFAAIHGFRMPVFFLLSGFFTAMLWRRRGMKSMLTHRFRRVLLPFLLGLVTIVPAVNWISGRAIASGLEASAERDRKDSIWNAARYGDLAAMERHLRDGADVDGMDPETGVTPLVWAALAGRPEAARVERHGHGPQHREEHERDEHREQGQDGPHLLAEQVRPDEARGAHDASPVRRPLSRCRTWLA